MKKPGLVISIPWWVIGLCAAAYVLWLAFGRNYIP